MAGAAVGGAGDDIGAPVPGGRPRRIGLEFTGPEIERIPDPHDPADIHREGKPIAVGRIGDRRHGAQEGVDRIGVGAGQLREIGIGERRIEMRAIGAAALVQGPVELLVAPVSDAGGLVGGDVGGLHHAEFGLELAAARVGAGGRRVAAGAFTHRGQITAARHGVVAGLGDACRTPEQAEQQDGEGEAASVSRGALQRDRAGSPDEYAHGASPLA